MRRANARSRLPRSAPPRDQNETTHDSWPGSRQLGGTRPQNHSGARSRTDAPRGQGNQLERASNIARLFALSRPRCFFTTAKLSLFGTCESSQRQYFVSWRSPLLFGMSPTCHLCVKTTHTQARVRPMITSVMLTTPSPFFRIKCCCTSLSRTKLHTFHSTESAVNRNASVDALVVVYLCWHKSYCSHFPVSFLLE